MLSTGGRIGLYASIATAGIVPFISRIQKTTDVQVFKAGTKVFEKKYSKAEYQTVGLIPFLLPVLLPERDAVSTPEKTSSSVEEEIVYDLITAQIR
jgi:hypothetical protein